MNKNVLNEISQMKFLFGYKPGKVLSEQESVEEVYMDEDSDFMDFEDIEMMPSPDVAEPDVKPDVDRPDTDRPSRPRPSRPDYDPAHIPNPNPDTHPQGSEEDEVSYELELDDMPVKNPMGRMRDIDIDMELDDMPRPRRMKDMSRSRMRDLDMVENVYEIEVDGSIDELFN
jgi:hypothetical protein